VHYDRVLQPFGRQHACYCKQGIGQQLLVFSIVHNQVDRHLWQCTGHKLRNEIRCPNTIALLLGRRWWLLCMEEWRKRRGLFQNTLYVPPCLVNRLSCVGSTVASLRPLSFDHASCQLRAARCARAAIVSMQAWP
jgi:hypothetical protein